MRNFDKVLNWRTNKVSFLYVGKLFYWTEPEFTIKRLLPKQSTFVMIKLTLCCLVTMSTELAMGNKHIICLQYFTWKILNTKQISKTLKNLQKECYLVILKWVQYMLDSKND